MFIFTQDTQMSIFQDAAQLYKLNLTIETIEPNSLAFVIKDNESVICYTDRIMHAWLSRMLGRTLLWREEDYVYNADHVLCVVTNKYGRRDQTHLLDKDYKNHALDFLLIQRRITHR